MGELMEEFGKGLEQDPSYQRMSDAEKAATWEQLVMGTPNDPGFIEFVHEMGLQANPAEAMRREAQKTMPGPMQRKVTGDEEILKQMKKEGVKK
jgi:hypothetical protein